MKIKDYKEDIKLLLDTKDNKTIANGLAKMIKYVEQSYNIPKDQKLYFLSPSRNGKKLDWDLYCKTDGGKYDYCDIAELYTSEDAEQVAAFYMLYGVMLNEFFKAEERHMIYAKDETAAKPTDPNQAASTPQPLEIPQTIDTFKLRTILTALDEKGIIKRIGNGYEFVNTTQPTIRKVIELLNNILDMRRGHGQITIAPFAGLFNIERASLAAVAKRGYNAQNYNEIRTIILNSVSAFKS